jgi:hypothetical protein
MLFAIPAIWSQLACFSALTGADSAANNAVATINIFIVAASVDAEKL